MIDITGIQGEAAAGRGEALRRQSRSAVAAGKADDQRLRDACQGFEAIFLAMMYKEMRNTVHDDPLLGTSNGEKIWQSMLDSEMCDRLAKAGGVGLADMMYRQLTIPTCTTGEAALRAAAESKAAAESGPPARGAARL